VALARAFAGSPSILLADEPTGNLDRKTGRMVLEVLGDLRGRFGTTLVLVTHDPPTAALARRHLRLDEARLLEEPPAAPEPG
jgi:putative ABC transport system ATP-binding protein